jgi:thiamine biosynthesis lipoprotein
MRIVVPELDPGAFAGLDTGAPVRDIAGETMGTGWRVKFCAPLSVDASALCKLVQARLDGLVVQMSHWDEASLLCLFGASPAGQWISLPADFAAVMEAGLAIAEKSGGAFDPAIGRLTDLYGLGPRPAQGEPDQSAIETARNFSGWRSLAFQPATGRLRQPGDVWLDLSGIAKGYAVDAVADLLAGQGVRHCLVEIGGECVGRGMRPDGDPWWVDLETPPETRAEPIRIALHQLAVATSGNYVRGDHTLDPRTGRRASNGIASVSVLHPRAMIADAWATAITVLGLEEGAAHAIREGLAVHILAKDGAMTREWISPALAEMMVD